MNPRADLAAGIWTALAIYGCIVQYINVKWAIYKRRVIMKRAIPSTDELIAVRAHMRVNYVRTLCVGINLFIGLVAILHPLPVRGMTFNGIAFAIGLIINEIGWNTIITVEIRERAKLRRAASRDR
jgi:hypothetical protein